MVAQNPCYKHTTKEMDMKELRIGNYIKSIGIIYKLISVDIKGNLKGIDDVTTFNLDGYYTPIPLTEEWLLKFGFERLSYEKNYPLYINKNKDGYSHSFFVSIHSDFSRVSIVNQSLRTLKYVHELQNLYFALTQTELTIS